MRTSPVYRQCGEGWNDLIDVTLELIEREANLNKAPIVEYHQIKEKFGELRIYYAGGSERTDAYVEFAQRMSRNICEECGCPATLKSRRGWITTRCEEHV
jgi:hypothetical protein